MFGGLLQIETHKLDFKEKAEARIGSKDNMNYAARRQVKVIFHKVVYSDVLEVWWDL